MEQKDLFTEDNDKSLLASFAWWEKRRWLYNLIVALTGIWIFVYFPATDLANWAGVLFYGLLANMFYCLGFLIEVVARFYFKSDMDFSEKRKTIFVLGLIISVLLTAGIVFLVSLAPPATPF